MRQAHIYFQVFGFSIRLLTDEALKNNTGSATRLHYLGNSNTIELFGRLHADLFNSDKMLINGVDMNIKLALHRKVFIF
jgi:hypothetical protein